MNANFTPSLALVLKHEGGFVMNPHDPGGATCWGVTQETYDNFRSDNGLQHRSVRDLDQDEIETIYRKLYWDAIRADELPSGVDYATFDFAFNSGPNRAARFLQRMVGAVEDGKIGSATIAAVKAVPPQRLIDALCDARLIFLKSLNTWKFFGRGWAVRVSDVRTKAKEMAA